MELILIIFTFGYILQHLASFILIKRISQKRSVEGLSMETQIFYLVGAFSRLIWVQNTRLSSNYLAWLELLLSFFLSIYILYLFLVKYKYTRQDNTQKIGIIIIILAIILSFVFQYGRRNQYYWSDQILVAFTMYLEALAMLPQVYLIRKQKNIEHKLNQYIVILAFSRIMRMFFWIMMLWEGNKFYYLVAADLIHTLLLGDFLYFYFFKNQQLIVI